jgi:(R)-2-hydroxyglutarate---pyruvate transhydrogenase
MFLQSRKYSFSFLRACALSTSVREYQRAIDHVSSLQQIIGSEKVQVEDIDQYIYDWTKLYQGGGVVCFPSSTEEVQRVMKYCNDHHIGVVPQGGNTGLVGGAVGMADELILSTSKMREIRSIDSVSGTRLDVCKNAL